MSNLMSAVDELFSVDVRAMPDAVLVDEIVDLAGQINRLSAAYLARLEVVDRRGGMAAEHGSTAAWLRAALRLSPSVASRDVHLSRDLADVMPSVATAMADGEVSVAHAQVLAGLRKDLPDDVVRSVDPHLADGARTRTPIELRGFVTHVRHSYAPDAVLRDEREAYDERRLQASTTMYGTGVGDWTCDPVSHETIMTAIHAASAPVADDDRTPAQRRLDGLLSVCEIALRSGELPDTGGVKPHVTVVVDLTTLAGREAAAAAGLAFGAAVSGDAARRIGCDADIARVIAGPAGEVLDSGRSTRTFTAAQRRAIIARDRHCRWPGCDRPPGWCEATTSSTGRGAGRRRSATVSCCAAATTTGSITTGSPSWSAPTAPAPSTSRQAAATECASPHSERGPEGLVAHPLIDQRPVVAGCRCGLRLYGNRSNPHRPTSWEYS